MNRPLLLGALLLLAACATDEQGPGPARRIVLLGRLERSSVVRWRLLQGGDTLPDSLVTLTVSDTTRATVMDSSRVRFDSAGDITLFVHLDSIVVPAFRTISLPPTIVYDQLSDSGDRDVWSATLDGQDRTRLTTDAADDRDPTVVGSKVVFTSYRTGGGDLYSVTLAGGTATRITSGAEEEADPALAPDGVGLAYTRLLGGIPKLYRSSGGAPIAVTGALGDGAVDASPSWSPDGGRLVFASSGGGPVRLWTATLQTGALDTLRGYGGTGVDVEPAWSPDGGRVAFASTRDGPTEIYVATIATGAVTRLTLAGGSNGRPAWTVDGRVLFVTFVSGHPALHWVDPGSPGVIHDIPVGPDADHPASPW